MLIVTLYYKMEVKTVAYSSEAIFLRRCLGHNKDGSPCKSWALWSAPDQKCPKHSAWYGAVGKSPAPRCDCDAYPFPHRPGGGLCEWPNKKPRKRSTTTPGKHRTPRRKPKWTVEVWSYDSTKDPDSKLDAMIEMEEKRKNERTQS